MILEDCFEEKDVIRLMRQIIDGVKFLHNASIVHLDIKVRIDNIVKKTIIYIFIICNGNFISKFIKVSLFLIF